MSLRFLPEAVRDPLALAYLLARTSDTLADSETVPIETRLHALQVFQDALAKGRVIAIQSQFPALQVPHPGEAALLECSSEILKILLAQPEEIRKEIQSVLATIIAGQQTDLTRFGQARQDFPIALKSTADLVAYTYSVAGCVGEFWTRICVMQLPRFAILPQATLVKHGRLFGQGLQLVNILRDLPADLKAGRCYLPETELNAHQLTPNTLLTSPSLARPIVARWISQAEQWLEQGLAYEKGIRGISLRFSVSLPRRLGTKTLAALKLSPPLETSAKIKVSRATVFECATTALLRTIL